MPAIAPTVANATEFAGAYKVLVVTATLTSNDDSITLVAATHGIRTIAKVDAQITLGMDANCQTV